MNLQGKKIILTGSSSGIGLELLSLLHEKGAKILAVDSQKPAQKIPSITYMQEDISTQNGVDKLFNMSDNVLGEIDIFIANAGFSYYMGVDKSDWNQTKAIFDTNVYSPIYSFYKLKKIKGNKVFQFVVTASAMSFMPLPGYSLYSGTKHAIQGFFETARLELPKNQIITLIYPVSTKTAFFDKDARIPNPNQTAITVAKHYLKGIEKNKSRIYPAKSLFFAKIFTPLQAIAQKIENYHFNIWKKKNKGEI